MELDPRIIALNIRVHRMSLGNLCPSSIQFSPSLLFSRHQSMSVCVVHLTAMHDVPGRAHRMSDGPRDLYWSRMNACKGVLRTEKNYCS